MFRTGDTTTVPSILTTLMQRQGVMYISFNQTDISAELQNKTTVEYWELYNKH